MGHMGVSTEIKLFRADVSKLQPTGQPPGFLNKVKTETQPYPLLLSLLAAELSSYNRNCMSHKA